MDPTWRCRPAVTSTSPGPLDKTSGFRTTGEQDPDDFVKTSRSEGCQLPLVHIRLSIHAQQCWVPWIAVVFCATAPCLGRTALSIVSSLLLLPNEPHRGTSRRIQNMGFVRDRAAEGLWMTLNGGAMQMSTTLPEGTSDPVFSDTAIKSGGYGIIDVAWKVGTGVPPV